MFWSSLLMELRRVPQIIDLAIFFLVLHLRQRLFEPATMKAVPITPHSAVGRRERRMSPLR
jgi:hypothetical protein